MTVSKLLVAYEDGQLQKKKNEDNLEALQNLHSIIWPAGTSIVSCKKTKKTSD